MDFYDDLPNIERLGLRNPFSLFLDAASIATASLSYSWVLPYTGMAGMFLTVVSNQAYRLLIISVKNTGSVQVTNVQATVVILSNSSPAWSISTSATAQLDTLLPAETAYGGWTLKASFGNNKQVKLHIEISGSSSPAVTTVVTVQMTITTS